MNLALQRKRNGIETMQDALLFDKYSTLAALAKIVLDSRLDPELRGTAYLSTQEIAGNLTVAEFAKAPSGIEKFDVDWECLKTFKAVQGRPCTPEIV